MENLNAQEPRPRPDPINAAQTPYQRGYDDFRFGRANPFPKGAPGHEAWQRGNYDAWRESLW